jgi:hypothetical protein
MQAARIADEKEKIPEASANKTRLSLVVKANSRSIDK